MGVSARKAPILKAGYLFYCLKDRNYRKDGSNLMSLLMLGTVAVAVLGKTLLVEHGMLRGVSIYGGVGQPHCFSHLYSILASGQSYQSFTSTILKSLCSTLRFTLGIMVLHVSIGTSSYRT